MSLVAASAANAVQTGTKEITSKVFGLFCSWGEMIVIDILMMKMCICFTECTLEIFLPCISSICYFFYSPLQCYQIADIAVGFEKRLLSTICDMPR